MSRAAATIARPVIRLVESTTATRGKRRPSGRQARAVTPSGKKLRLVTEVEKDEPGMATDYKVRLAPYAVARIRLQRVSAEHSWVDWVFVPEGWRDCGLGGQLMRHVLRDADRFGVRLSLEARACGETDQRALERWYEGLGFVRANRRGPLGPIYVRRPAARQRAA